MVGQMLQENVIVGRLDLIADKVRDDRVIHDQQIVEHFDTVRL